MDDFRNELEAIFDRIDPIDVLDVALIALIIYGAFLLLRGTAAIALLRGAAVLLVGVVILAQALPSKYAEIAEQYRNLSGVELQARESAAINATHADVSAMVLQLWMLPEAIVEAVRHHHAAADSIPLNAPGRDTASFLGAGDTIAQCLCVAEDADQAAATCIRAVEPLGMDAGGLC